jgi:hypothetical protein
VIHKSFRDFRPLRYSSRDGFAAHRQSIYWNFMYHSRIGLSVGCSVGYVARNHLCTVTIDSVLTNSKTQNAFLFAVHAMFRNNCPLAEKPAITSGRLGHKKTWRDSLPIDMHPFGVTIPATVPQRSEFRSDMNYPVFTCIAPLEDEC